ncbi:MAG: hypothetical protein RR775_13885 [Massilia sp.]
MALRQHLCSGVTSLRNEGCTLLNRMDGLPDRFDHECMRADAKHVRSTDCALLEFIGKFQ